MLTNSRFSLSCRCLSRRFKAEHCGWPCIPYTCVPTDWAGVSNEEHSYTYTWLSLFDYHGLSFKNVGNSLGPQMPACIMLIHFVLGQNAKCAVCRRNLVDVIPLLTIGSSRFPSHHSESFSPPRSLVSLGTYTTCDVKYCYICLSWHLPFLS